MQEKKQQPTIPRAIEFALDSHLRYWVLNPERDADSEAAPAIAVTDRGLE